MASLRGIWGVGDQRRLVLSRHLTELPYLAAGGGSREVVDDLCDLNFMPLIAQNTISGTSPIDARHDAPPGSCDHMCRMGNSRWTFKRRPTSVSTDPTNRHNSEPSSSRLERLSAFLA
jgi:hypothetical protein